MNELKSTDTGFMANPLIQAGRDFSLLGTRLFYLGLRCLRPHLPNSKEYDEYLPTITIDTETVIKIFGGNKTYYKLLRETCKQLSKATISIEKEPGKKRFKDTPVFALLEFDADEGGLKLEFNHHMEKYLLDLYDKPYTKINIMQVFSLGSTYAVRILELLLQYSNIKPDSEGKIYRTIELDYLRIYLGIKKDDYKRMYDFKKNVLDKPIEELNNKTGFYISYETIKNGRSVSAFRFAFCEKDSYETGLEALGQIRLQDATTPALPSPTPRRRPRGLSGLADEQKELYKVLTANEIGEKVALSIVKKRPTDFLKKEIDYLLSLAKKRKPDNLGGFLRKAFEEEYYKQYLDGIEEKKAQEKAKKENRKREIIGSSESKELEEIREICRGIQKQVTDGILDYDTGMNMINQLMESAKKK